MEIHGNYLSSSDLGELEELLLVHGTINKRALSEVIFYSIYRNLVLVLVQVANLYSNITPAVFASIRTSIIVFADFLHTLSGGMPLQVQSFLGKNKLSDFH